MRTARTISGSMILATLALSCAPGPTPLAAAPRPAPTFSDPVALITWLITHSSRDFQPLDDAATANVFSPGLRAAIRASMQRSRQRIEPPCGANGDITLDTQETGPAQNLRLTPQPTAPDRVTVAASFDIVGYHRDRRYQTVNLDGAWKLENIMEANNTSLRRSLACQ